MDTVSLDGLQRAVDALATRLGRSVAVDDTRGRLVVASRHFGDEDPLRTYAVLQRDSDPRVTAHFEAHDIHRWTRPGRVPANSAIGFKARVCCPVRAHGLPFGHLFLIDDGVDEQEIELAAAVADDIGRLLHRRLVLHDRDEGRRDRLARDLVGDDEAARAAARRDLVGEGHVVDPVGALAVHVPAAGDADTALRVALERLARGRYGGRLLITTTGPRATVLVLGPPGGDELRALGVELVADLRRAVPGARPVVGIGGPGQGTDAARDAHDEAHAAAATAALLPELGDVVGTEDLGVFAVLSALPSAAATRDRLPPALQRLLARDERLVGTLEVYLDECGDATRTAKALRIHRSTLYYRLGRIEALGEVDLHNGRQRLALHVGVKLRRLLDAHARDEGRSPSDTSST